MYRLVEAFQLHLPPVLGDKVYESHYRHGGAMTVHQAMDYALEQITLVLNSQPSGPATTLTGSPVK